MSSPSPNHRKLSDLSRLFRLARKELVEILRDRRTIITLVLMPLLVYPLMGMVVQKLVVQSLTQSESPVYLLGIASEDAQKQLDRMLILGDQSIKMEQLSQKRAAAKEKNNDSENRSSNEAISEKLKESLAETQQPKLRFDIKPIEELEPLVQEGKIDLAIALETVDRLPVFRMIYNSQSTYSKQVLGFVQKRLRYSNEIIAANSYYKQNGQPLPDGQPPTPPVLVREQPVASASNQPLLLTFVPLMLVLMTITGAVYPAIDLTAGERERGTMEILVAAPVPRLLVLCGKFFAVLAVAILTAIANLIAMLVTVFSLGFDQLVFGESAFSVATICSIFALLVVLAAFFSATLLCLTSFARSFKEAQAYLIPLMLVAFAPGLVSLSPNLESSPMLAIIPLVNIVLTGRDLLAGQAVAVHVAVALVSTTIYALMALSFAARIFGTDSILTGGRSSWSDLFKRSATTNQVLSPSMAMTFLAVLFPAFIIAAGLSSNIAVKLDLALPSRLFVNAGITIALFLAMPYWLSAFAKLNKRLTFSLYRPTILSVLAAVLMGSAVWMFAYEVQVFTLPENRISEMVELFGEMKDQFRQTPLWIKLICLAAAPAICEEFTFRGIMLSALKKRSGNLYAVVVTAIMFGLFHIFFHNSLTIERLLPSTLMGLLLGWVCVRSGSIFPGMILHAIHNGMLMCLGHYENVLGDWGLDVENQQHLPFTWLAVAAVIAGLGLATFIFQHRQHNEPSPHQ